MSRRVNDLRSRVGDLKFKLREAENRLRDALIEEAPFKVGDVALTKFYEDDVEVIVRRVYVRHGELDYRVSERRVNGEWMSRERDAWRGLRPVPE
jgi:hypothetical protein